MIKKKLVDCIVFKLCEIYFFLVVLVIMMLCILNCRVIIYLILDNFKFEI